MRKSGVLIAAALLLLVGCGSGKSSVQKELDVRKAAGAACYAKVRALETALLDMRSRLEVGTQSADYLTANQKVQAAFNPFDAGDTASRCAQDVGIPFSYAASDYQTAEQGILGCGPCVVHASDLPTYFGEASRNIDQGIAALNRFRRGD